MAKKRRDYSDLLLWSAVLVTVVRYAGAFIASDLGSVTGWVSDGLSVGMGITGLGMGILDVLGTAYIFDGWRRAMPAVGKRWPFRFKVLTFFAFALFTTGLGILVPFTVSRVLHQAMGDVLIGGWLWGWAMLVNVAPLLLVAGIATGQAQVFALPTEKHGNAKHMSASQEQMLSDAPVPVYTCEHCGTLFTSWQAKAAHMRWQHSDMRR